MSVAVGHLGRVAHGGGVLTICVQLFARKVFMRCAEKVKRLSVRKDCCTLLRSLHDRLQERNAYELGGSNWEYSSRPPKGVHPGRFCCVGFGRSMRLPPVLFSGVGRMMQRRFCSFINHRLGVGRYQPLLFRQFPKNGCFSDRVSLQQTSYSGFEF